MAFGIDADDDAHALMRNLLAATRSVSTRLTVVLDDAHLLTDVGALRTMTR
ncbi:MAG TPA: hypothetical protein VIC62_16520 [Nakamurella sp.]|jgi:hypothetical protein